MHVFGEFLKSTGEVVRLTRQEYRGVPRMDLREFWRPDPGAELRPTRRGVAVPISALPALRHAIEAAELAAIRAGLIVPGEGEVSADLARPPAEIEGPLG